MKTSLSFTFLALALAASIQCEAHAQEKQLQVTQDKQYKVKVKGDKVIVSASGQGVFALGTVVGDYQHNDKLEYRHSRKVRWDTTWAAFKLICGGATTKIVTPLFVGRMTGRSLAQRGDSRSSN